MKTKEKIKTIRKKHSVMNAKELNSTFKVLELKPILALEEVRDLLKVSRSTLTNWDNNKILVKRRIGKKVFYDSHDILRFFKSKDI